MAEIKLIALDLDGTLFNSRGVITPACLEAIDYASKKGIHVVISTGRPYSGIPFEQIEGCPITYALTTNGAAAYRIADRKLIFEETLPDETSFEFLDLFEGKPIHVCAFIAGDGITPNRCKAMVPDLVVPDSIKATYDRTRIHVPDVHAYIREHGQHVQKFTLNFTRDEKGVLIDRKPLEAYLQTRKDISVVCGGFSNLEITRSGIDKGKGMLRLAKMLGVKPEETMAIGDSENDYSIIRAAAIGVAMDNAEEMIREAACYITASNDEDGVAKAIYHFIPAGEPH